MQTRTIKILDHHRTVSKDGQAVHIEEMIDAMRSLGYVGNARRVVALAQSASHPSR